MILDFFKFLFMFFSGMGISILFIVHVVYLPLKNNENELIDPNVEYLSEYTDVFDNLNEEVISNEKKSLLKKNILFEFTPIGYIIMYYNDENDEFNYYSDRIPSYGFLETVSRKYVVTFHCKSIYKIYENEKDKYEAKENKEKEDNEKKNSKKKSVYANFKRYNNTKSKINDNEPILQNKYKRLGLIREFNVIKKENKITKREVNINDFLLQLKSKSK